MTFQDSIVSVINDFGKDILISSSLMNVLNDYNAFSEERYLKNVVTLLNEKRYLEQLYNISDYDNYTLIINQIPHELYNEYGVSKDVSYKVLNSFIIGLGLEPIEQNIGDSETRTSSFTINAETEKRLNTYHELLGTSYKECGELLAKQGKYEDAINFYKLGANKGDSQCLVLLTKLYMEDNIIANDHDAIDCCNRYFNSFFDIIGNGTLDLSDIKEEHIEMYAKGFYKIISVALQQNKTNLFHPNIEFFILGIISTKLFNMLDAEMENVSDKLSELESKHKIGLLKTEDYSYYNSLQSRYDSIMKYIEYLHSLVDKTRKYEGQRMTLSKI